MAKYKVLVSFAFHGSVEVEADDSDHAEMIVENDFGMVSGNIHTTLVYDYVKVSPRFLAIRAPHCSLTDEHYEALYGDE